MEEKIASVIQTFANLEIPLVCALEKDNHKSYAVKLIHNFKEDCNCSLSFVESLEGTIQNFFNEERKNAWESGIIESSSNTFNNGYSNIRTYYLEYVDFMLYIKVKSFNQTNHSRMVEINLSFIQDFH